MAARKREKPSAAADPKPNARTLLGRERWIEAGVAALIDGGLGAVSVERIAAALEVTKGSFYWHFANKEELVLALALRWEELGTDRVIAELEAIADPRLRLASLLRVSLDDVAHLKAEASLSAAGARGDEAIAPVVARVMKRRLDYTEQCYRALGISPAEARRMAVAAYGAYVGCVQLAGHGLLSLEERALRAQVKTLERLLIPE